MFDRITVEGTKFPSKIEVTEKRAVTDESVRLLSEMEAAAEKRVLGRGVLESNLLNTIRWTVFYQGHTDRTLLAVRFDLNGKEIAFDMEVDQRRFRMLGAQEGVREMISSVHKRVSEEIGRHITMHVLTDGAGERLLNP